jgi:hypothetical protein
MSDFAIPHLETVLQKFATRMAISLVFAVPYIEACFLRDGPERKFTNPPAPQRISQCHNCGSEKKKVSGGAKEPF